MREYNANERKLLKVSNSPWFTWGMALFWALAAGSNYYHHHFTWLSGLVAGLWIILALIEITKIVLYRRKKGASPEATE